MADGINLYKLMPAWYAFKCDNDLSGNHTDVFFYLVDLNNSLAWKEVFGVPSRESAEILNMSPNTFRKCFNDLVVLKVVKLVKRSKNQLSANQISMRAAYQNLLKLRNSDYAALVKAQAQQLRSACAIDKHRDIETNRQIDKLKAKNTEQYQEIESLKLKLKKEKAKNKAVEDKATNQTTCLTFESFWILYDKKTGQQSKIKAKFGALNEDQRAKILSHVPLYKQSQPDKKFRKNPETYLNNEGWNDEIIQQATISGGHSGQYLRKKTQQEKNEASAIAAANAMQSMLDSQNIEHDFNEPF